MLLSDQSKVYGRGSDEEFVKYFVGTPAGIRSFGRHISR
jgi:hypothetical protein